MSTPRPYVLVAELTYRCPLACAYCSNPTAPLTRASLTLADWRRVLDEAAALGVLQVHFTGGEPLLVPWLEDLVAHARGLELYTHLVTSGMPLTRARLARLAELGLDAMQLSWQSTRPSVAVAIAGHDAGEEKHAAAAWARELELPLTLNVVLHRHNLDEVDDLIALAERLGVERLELANTQFLGWARVNRDALMPSAAQLDAARATVAAARERLRGQMELLFVMPDHHSGRPRTCMGGWGERYLVVSPDGRAMPCQAAHVLPLELPDVRAASLGSIWRDSDAFTRFRGTAFLGEPCRSCPELAVDRGGCRCQAFLATGDATATDPACDRAPTHGLIEAARAAGHAASSPAPARRVLRVLA
jgi:pyrroloquinoline quinone biosynthesis protein E